MRRGGVPFLIGIVLLAGGLIAASAEGTPIRISGSSALSDSGLYSKLRTMYDNSPYYVPGDTLNFTASGSGQALTSAEQGFADVVITDSPAAEARFVAPPPLPANNNFGGWIADSSGSMLGLNDGGDSTFKLSFGQVVAASGETVLNRTAEQSTDASPGVFQAGSYTGSSLDGGACASTALGEQVLFTEWRDAGAGNMYNCNTYGDASLLSSCDANVALVSGTSYEWNAELGCPAATSRLTVQLNWGQGINDVGGELVSFPGSGFPDASTSNVFYDPSYSWVTWTAINRGSPAFATPALCLSPSAGWSEQAPDGGGGNFAMAHTANDPGVSC
jgi:hypothetical protein